MCELSQVHRFNDRNLLQDAYKCANNDDINFDDYTKDEHDLCLCWANQAVDANNQKRN